MKDRLPPVELTKKLYAGISGVGWPIYMLTVAASVPVSTLTARFERSSPSRRFWNSIPKLVCRVLCVDLFQLIISQENIGKKSHRINQKCTLE